ncbi:TetR/AcrR family transcriptional regulator [Microbacterium soli]|uniref:TetR/AcrR family transcriptional regulator n=1 Tax=Microbacterium soli TaxID=446075 RepID=UPI0031D1759E
MPEDKTDEPDETVRTQAEAPSAKQPASVGRPRRSRRALLDAAAAVFAVSGVDAPVRVIAERAGVGVGTIYRHFPTRPELVVAVYRHQVEACADAAPRLLAESASPEAALRAWIAMFVDFLVTKHGLAGALRGHTAESDALHAYFVDRLVPVCGGLLDAARAASATVLEIDAYSVLRAVGNLCIGAETDRRYQASELVQALISGILLGGGR